MKQKTEYSAVSGSTAEGSSRHSFSGQLGYILAAAGASVGLGNIWRFPYLAARYGGGIFLLIYIALAVTFGYTMIVAETVIGRRTRKSPVGAFRAYSDNRFFHAGGWINAIVPMLIVPYYSTIGGWVVNYLVQYLTGGAHAVAADGYFGEFISNGAKSELWFLVFAFCTLAVIFAGVRSGIERVSRIMMPVLVVLAVIVSIYSVTRPGALAGVAYFLIPNPRNFSWMTVVSAMGQMFYSLSIAMGILITFGSREGDQKCGIVRHGYRGHRRADDHPGSVRVLGRRRLGSERRSEPYVHHHPEGSGQHGNVRFYGLYVLPAGIFRRADIFCCPD